MRRGQNWEREQEPIGACAALLQGERVCAEFEYFVEAFIAGPPSEPLLSTKLAIVQSNTARRRDESGLLLPVLVAKFPRRCCSSVPGRFRTTASISNGLITLRQAALDTQLSWVLGFVDHHYTSVRFYLQSISAHLPFSNF